MRILAVAFVFGPLLAATSGCGPCHGEGVATDCGIVGTLQEQLTDGTVLTSQGLEASCGPRSFSFGGQNLLGGRDQVTAPQALKADLGFVVHPSTEPPSGSGHQSVDLALTVRSVPLGPSEIDLDDIRAQIDGWSGLAGHISITALSEDCSHGSSFCLIMFHSTFELSAVAPDGRTFSLTAAWLDVQDTYVRQETMCAAVGE